MMNKLVISEVLAGVNLLVVIVLFLCVRYVPLDHPMFTATQFVIIPALLIATIAFAVRDFLRTSTRVQSLAALVLSVPVGFIYSVWQGWIAP
jgi:Sec-independent protein secretion pathway component TatC